MNGQPLTNSSNSANGTPSSSYPGSISSQSSREPSPATRVRKPLPEPYNHVMTGSNHWPPPPAPGKGVETQSASPIPAPASQYLPQDLKTPAAHYNNQAQIPLSSQPVHKYPPPTSLPPSSVPQTNSKPQTNNTFRSLNQQPTNPPPPTQVLPQNNSSVQNTSANLFSSQSNQFKPVDAPIQQSGNKFQHSPVIQAPSKPPQSSQTSQATSQSFQQLNQFPPTSQLPSQTPSQAPFQNQLSSTSQPSSQTPPIQNQFSSNSQLPSQTPFQNQFSSTSQPPSFQNQFSQLPKQFNLPPGQPPAPSAFPPSSNQFSQPPGKMMPPQNSGPPQASQVPQPQSQIPPSKSRYPQYPNQMPPSANQSIPPTIQSQAAYHASQFAKMPVQAQPPPNQFPPPNQIPPVQNKYPQPSQPSSYQNHLPQQPNQVNNYQNQYPNSGYQQQPQNQVPNQFNNRYPQMPGTTDGLASNMAGLTVNQGFNRLWGMDSIDLLKCRDLLPRGKVEPPHIRLQHELYEAANCSPDIFRCTLTKIPETKSLLDKSRLPLGVLIHPFKDLNQLSVIQCAVIVRCRVCRTYINPFVYFVDNKRWKCNLCFRVNELPDEFQFDPMTKSYGDPSRRPEIKSATIEFIAPSEYMVRPPQPAVYVFLLDVSRLACESGYLDTVCQTLLAELDNIPGDARTSISFITFDSAIHFFSLTEGQGQPHQMTVVDIDDVFLPTPDNLMVNLNDCRELIRDLLEKLPGKYKESYDTHSALGAALQAAYKLLAPTGGRVTVFQSCLPNAGPGALTPREDPAQRAGDNPPHLNPSTDFYKKLALDCSGQQIAVDLFLINSQYVDLATISGVSKFSGGCMFHIPLFRSDKPHMVDTLERSFQRYLTRKIGFESVMRIRCTRGLSIHTFHGNFFVRSTDLLSLPNANPDAGFGMQVTIDENLSDVQNVSFQAALLYTSSKGERRIRVHTLCLPVASNLADILHGADQQAIVGLLSKMAVDRATQSSLSDAREAFFNVVGDVLSSYKLTQSSNTTGMLLAPSCLSLLPTYVLALLKHTAFRVGQSTRLDDRVFAMCQMKTLPLHLLMQSVYPDLYSLRDIETQVETASGVPQVPRLQLSAERIDSLGLFLMDDGCTLLLYVGHNLPPHTCQAVFDVPHFSAIPQELYSLPELENSTSEAIRNFIAYLQNEKPFPLPLQVIRDDSHHRMKFLERLVEDKNECGTSYYEFLQRVKTLLN